MKEAVSMSLIEKKVDEDGMIHDVFRPVEEVNTEALNHLRQKYSKELELLETE